MKIKKYAALLLAGLMLVCCVACGKNEVAEVVLPEPEEGRLKSICQLSVLEGYFHNVVKYQKENKKTGFLKPKDTHLWVEYTGVAKYGLDASKVKMEVSGKEITITLPKAKLLYTKVDSTSLDENSYIVAKDSAKVTAEDSRDILVKAQEKLDKEAADYEELFTKAQQHAQELMEDYVKNIVTTSGADANEYTINWVYLNEE